MNLDTNLGSSETTVTTTPGRRLLTVVIVSWNVKELLRQCLRSLEDDHISDWAEVVVVDNASTDQLTEMVRAEFARVKVIVNSENLGFSRANNLAIRQSTGEFVILLNPDTVVHRGALRKLVDFARSHPEVGVVGPKLCASDGLAQYEGAVEFPTIWNVFCDLAFLSKVFPRSRLFCSRKMGHWDHEGDREVPAVSGAAMLVRSEVFDRIGLLNETLFYAEDMDFCLRLRRAGWSVFYLGSASIVHLGGGSTKTVADQGFQRQIAFQSTWLYTRENRSPMLAAALSVMVVLWSLGGIAVTSLLRICYRGNTPAAATVARFRQMAVSLLYWSVSNKKKFRHHLAAPPTFGANGAKRVAEDLT
jgi:GT2 family glycosyltransferase